MLLLLSAALAANPCYEFAHEDRHETEHFWIEWSGDVISWRQAEDIGEWAEAARQDYIDLGWPMTDEAVSIVVTEPILDAESASGLTRTQPCTTRDGESPRVELFLGFWDAGYVEELTAHELGHVAQYGYVSPYTDATALWMWWLEASATWLELQSRGNELSWAYSVGNYRNRPWVGLHQSQAALLDPVRGSHMYGASALVRFLADNYGGPDLIRRSWEWGATRVGQPTSLFDMLTALELDAPAVWAHWMAVSTTMNFGADAELDGGILVLKDVSRLPRDGEPDTADRPEGFGLAAVRFEAKSVDAGQAISVTFNGDPGIPWQVVLVRVDGARKRAPVIEYTPLEVSGGTATGWVSGLQNQAAYLVASPIDTELSPRSFTWSAQAIDDPGPMEGTIVIGEATVESGCGCHNGNAGGMWLAGLLLLRRRRIRG